ncbi:MAG TPA: EamA-like transporter family protein, partial [Hyphomonadaceae bacterium]|nr:EamA-like transporter family protein [Hyphomonadaceae bacterium]
MHWANLLIGLGLASGMMIAAQGAINGRLSAAIGGPVQAATVSFCVGLTCLVIVNTL